MIVLFLLAALIALAGWRREIELRERAQAELREADASWEMLHETIVARATDWQGRALNAERQLIGALYPSRGAGGRFVKRD